MVDDDGLLICIGIAKLALRYVGKGCTMGLGQRTAENNDASGFMLYDTTAEGFSEGTRS